MPPKPKQGLRVGAYARVSTHDQQTLPLQKKKIREYAKSRGLELTCEYQEVGSGAKLRPMREKLMRAARRREIDLGTIEPSWHCRRESIPKRGVSLSDVINVLRDGEIVREPEWDAGHEQWKYRVECIDTEGDELCAITVIFDADATLLIVTVF
jgi:hypothetical protein